MSKDNFKVNFIGIGTPKSGTSWIYQCLKEHPQICMSEPKELHFFNRYHGFHKPDAPWKYYTEGMEWYRKHFKHCQNYQIKGEFDPIYIYDKEALLLIKKRFPKIKIIISLRNPIERAFSHYLHLKSKKQYKKLFHSFEEAIDKEPEFIEWGFYSKYLKVCFEIFPRKNILIVLTDDISKKPLKTIQHVYRFLEVDERFIPDSLYKKVNASTVRLSRFSKAIGRIYLSLEKHRWGKSMIRILKKMNIRKSSVDSLIAKIKKPLEMKRETRKYLQNVYQKEIENLGKLLNRDLSFWK